MYSGVRAVPLGLLYSVKVTVRRSGVAAADRRRVGDRSAHGDAGRRCVVVIVGLAGVTVTGSADLPLVAVLLLLSPLYVATQ